MPKRRLSKKGKRGSDKQILSARHRASSKIKASGEFEDIYEDIYEDSFLEEELIKRRKRGKRDNFEN